MNGRLMFSILLVVFIDLFGLSMLIPLLPGYALAFDASSSTIGFLYASYGVMQMIGAPFLGRLSDQYGRRPILIYSIIGTFFGFILLGFASSLPLLFLARLVAGASAGNLGVAQAYITDVTDAKNRAKGLGLIGAAFGIGFIFGPATGGLLAAYFFKELPAFIAAGLCVVNLALVLFWLPESLPATERAARLATGGGSRPAFSFGALTKAVTRPFVGSLLITRGGVNLAFGLIQSVSTLYLFGALTKAVTRPFVGSLLITRGGVNLAFGLIQSVSTLYLIKQFGLKEDGIAWVLTYVGVLSVIVQGFLAGRISARVRDDILILACVGGLVVSFLGWALVPEGIGWLWAFNVVQIPLSLSGGLLRTVLSSTLTKAVEPREVGGMLGLGSSIDSAMFAVAPIIGGLLLEQFGTSSLGGFGAIVLLIVFGYVFTSVFNHPMALQMRVGVQLAKSSTE